MASERGSGRRSEPKASASFPVHPDVAARWTYLFDNIADEFGGGFVTGEFLLLTDGRLFRRAAWSLSSNHSTRWEAGPWEIDEAWLPSADVSALFEHLTARGYDLYPPTPIPVDATSAGPFPGYPKLAGEPLHPAR
jgi:hypothetical protein